MCWPHLSGSAGKNSHEADYRKVQSSQVRKDHPVFRPGDTIRVNVRLKEGEGDKERIQPFEGVVMSRRGELLG